MTNNCYVGNVGLLVVSGLLVNGPYALITTAVAAELGVHPDLRGCCKALATVTAIIDGTGSIGAAVGPFLAGALGGLDNGLTKVFYMLMASDILALLVSLYHPSTFQQFTDSHFYSFWRGWCITTF